MFFNLIVAILNALAMSVPIVVVCLAIGIVLFDLVIPDIVNVLVFVAFALLAAAQCLPDDWMAAADGQWLADFFAYLTGPGRVAPPAGTHDKPFGMASAPTHPSQQDAASICPSLLPAQVLSPHQGDAGSFAAHFDLQNASGSNVTLVSTLLASASCFDTLTHPQPPNAITQPIHQASHVPAHSNPVAVDSSALGLAPQSQPHVPFHGSAQSSIQLPVASAHGDHVASAPQPTLQAPVEPALHSLPQATAAPGPQPPSQTPVAGDVDELALAFPNQAVSTPSDAPEFKFRCFLPCRELVQTFAKRKADVLSPTADIAFLGQPSVLLGTRFKRGSEVILSRDLAREHAQDVCHRDKRTRPTPPSILRPRRRLRPRFNNTGVSRPLHAVCEVVD